MDIACQRGLVADVFDMRFLVQYRLIQMGDTPTLWNVELEEVGEFFGGLTCHGVAPGAEGIKVKVSGRLAGAEIARTEEIKQGRTPLHTFRMDIDYANLFALTVYGKIGIKVWICKGEVLTKRDLNPNFIGGKSEVSDRKDRREEHGGGHRGGERRDDRRGGGGGGQRRDSRKG